MIKNTTQNMIEERKGQRKKTKTMRIHQLRQSHRKESIFNSPKRNQTKRKLLEESRKEEEQENKKTNATKREKTIMTLQERNKESKN